MTVADVATIERLKHEFCYATDDLDTERMQSLFVADCRLDTPLNEPAEGHDGIRRYFEWFAEQEYEDRAHNVFNPLVEVDGDEATGEWYYTVVYTLPNGNLEYGHGKFEDEFVRTADGWKIRSVRGRRRITRELHAEVLG